MTGEEIDSIFQAWLLEHTEGDFEWLKKNRPLLAHYTSIEVAEKILRDENIWLSNPTYMNDHFEMVYGINLATDLFSNNKNIEIFEKSDLAERVLQIYLHYVRQFEHDHMLDVYVACFCQHDIDDADGLLSMWRSYGAQGNGAALVFNTGFASDSDVPLISISRVNYLSNAEREEQLIKLIDSWYFRIKECDITRDNVHIPLNALFYKFVYLALTTKHKGFREEREWRLIYLPQLDETKILKPFFDYAITARGVEPKLKLPIRPLPYAQETWALVDVLESIIIGPTVSSLLSERSFCRMLERIEKNNFVKKVKSSQIPLRQQHKYS